MYAAYHGYKLLMETGRVHYNLITDHLLCALRVPLHKHNVDLLIGVGACRELNQCLSPEMAILNDYRGQITYTWLAEEVMLAFLTQVSPSTAPLSSTSSASARPLDVCLITYQA